MKRFLLLKLGGVGDVVTATPAIRAIRKSHPDAFIALIAEAPGLEVVSGGPYVDEIIEFTGLYRCQTLTGLLRPRRLRDAARFARKVSSSRWDVFVSFQSLWRRSATIKPRIIAAMSRAKITAGLNTANNGTFLTHGIPDNRFDHRHYVDRFLDVVRSIGCEPDSRHTEVCFGDQDRAEAVALLRDAGVAQSDVACGIHPGGNPDYPLCTSWPVERFAAVANALIDQHDGKILITGSPGDRELCAELRRRIGQPGRVIDLSGKTSIKQLAACLEHCRLYISNDTGPMHIGVAVGTPTVGIFGPGDWQAYGYSPEMSFRLVRTDVDCSPCTNRQCTTRKCMNAVTVQDVLAAAEELLGEARG